MKFKTRLYRLLVERVPVIQIEYSKIRSKKKGVLGTISALCILLWINLCWICGNRRLEEKAKYPDSEKKADLIQPESMANPKKDPEDLVNHLFEAAIISFDIFDTLVFRPVSVPTDLFFFIEEKLNFRGFAKIRIEMERRVREKAYKESGTHEITLEEIYRELEKWTGINKEYGMKVEIETEESMCFANPYFQTVYSLLRKKIQGTEKRIICVSDMYLPQNVLEQILSNCGYHDVSYVYVSCEWKKSKADGTIYREVMKEYGIEKNYIHIGDNFEADIIRAKENGWEAIYYPNVNKLGLKCRAEDLSVITGSLYRGIVNSKLYNGLHQYNIDYEIGYVYGGLFVTAYCQFIHEYSKNNNIDKLLFLSCNGGIIREVYEYMYPEEVEKCEYVHWSRVVSTKLLAKYNRYNYIRYFIYDKVNQNKTLQEIYQSMGIKNLLESDNEIVLTDKNVETVIDNLLSNWSDLLQCYSELSMAGKLYYGEILKDCQKVLTIDVDGACCEVASLSCIANKEWNLNCDIIGMVAAYNAANDLDPNEYESFLYTGKIMSFLCSQEHNREHWKCHYPEKIYNLLIDRFMLFEENSLKNIVLDDNLSEGYRLVFEKTDVGIENAEEMQRGILDFVKDYRKYVFLKTKEHRISGSDAYAVLRILLKSGINKDTNVRI